jgi:hypothetical protein
MAKRMPIAAGRIGVIQTDQMLQQPRRKYTHPLDLSKRIINKEIRAKILEIEQLDAIAPWTVKLYRLSMLSFEYRVWSRAKIYRRFNSKTGMFKYL